jgi:hypothetical protein
VSLEQDLRAIVRDEVREALTEALADRASSKPAPTLLDRAGLANALGCSLPHVDKLRRQGMPCIRLGDVPRFELARCLEWLRGRE